MTRVNANLNVKSLLDQHLFAEYREILMVPEALKRSLNSRGVAGVLKSIPSAFCLNAGHVTYFYNKLMFLRERRKKIRAELLARGYSLNNVSELDIEHFPSEFKNFWQMSNIDREVITERIMAKYDMKPTWYKYHGKNVSRSEYVQILNME